jgi:thiosulfate/3-mercaptopyruvate sulfurtransferase
VVDCRFKLDDVSWGEQAYAAGHIRGAAYAHLDRDLSGAKTGSNGRHPLPDPQTLRNTLGRIGITSHMQVVAYDQDTGMYASRLWWLLRWLGHDAVAVLDGGFAKWSAEGRPLHSGIEGREPRTFEGEERREMTASIEAVQSIVDRGGATLVDARAPERYAGIVEPIDKVGGHIPTAVNYFYLRNLDPDGLFRTPDELRAQWRDSVGSVPGNDIVCYCGSGVTACHNLLALEHAGVSGVKLYPGSWSEWSSDPSRPIER